MAAKASSKTPSAGLDKRTSDLESAIAAITKSFGEGSIMRLGDEGANLKIEAVSTGSLGLDIALGVGGVAGAGRRWVRGGSRARAVRRLAGFRLRHFRG